MVWFGLILFIAVVVALLRGGRLSNLADIELRFWWLLPLGFLMQAGTGFLPESERSLTVATWLVLASFIPLSVVVAANRSRAGLWLSGLGIAMNAAVIAFNFGMPVMSEAAQIAGGTEGVVLIDDLRYVVLNGSKIGRASVRERV